MPLSYKIGSNIENRNDKNQRLTHSKIEDLSITVGFMLGFIMSNNDKQDKICYIQNIDIVSPQKLFAYLFHLANFVGDFLSFYCVLQN